MKHLRIFLLTIGLIATLMATINTNLAPLSASELSCDNVQVIFARGSGEPLNGPNLQTFIANVKPMLKQSAPSLKINYHELDYPAAGASTFAESLGVMVTAGNTFTFNDSVSEGQIKLKNYLKNTLSSCPNTKFVLAGYSQGALVMSKSLTSLNPEQIIYVATFGDPKLYLPEGFGIIPDACHGKNLSNYRQTVPDCHTDHGILTLVNDYQPNGYQDKLGAWCNAGDFMCGSYMDLLGGVLKDHTNYTTNGAYQEAARVITANLHRAFPHSTTTPEPIYSQHDVAILIDATNSMTSLFNKYYNKAISFAKEAVDKGGRVALFSYGDLSERNALQLCNFTTDLAEFQSALDMIKLEGGEDNNESALSALLYTMNTLKWQKGANKSIILLTDTSYHSPDLDGTTLPQVVQRSLEIDPVNIFVVSHQHILKRYQPLTDATGGATYLEYSDFATPVLSRPIVNLPQEFYATNIGDIIQFTVSANQPITKYDWDLDGDGQFELTTTEPTVSKTYTNIFSGYIQVKATNNSGLSSTASALVKTFDTITATINNITVASAPDSARVDFTAKNTAATLVLINNSPIGYTKENQINLTDLTTAVSVQFIPISASGKLGEPKTITASPSGFKPTTPRTGVR